jgi:hypothetical protein
MEQNRFNPCAQAECLKLVGQGTYCPKHHHQNIERNHMQSNSAKNRFEFNELVGKLLQASDAVADFCGDHGEPLLFQFFQFRGDGEDGIRHYIDAKLEEVAPTFEV